MEKAGAERRLRHIGLRALVAGCAMKAEIGGFSTSSSRPQLFGEAAEIAARGPMFFA
jgi:hypothetical protein